MEAFAVAAAILTFASFLALVNERLIEKFVKPVLQGNGWDAAVPYFALLTGALMSIGFGIDLITPLAEAAGLTPLSPWVGAIITSLAVGGGSNFLHDLWPGD